MHEIPAYMRVLTFERSWFFIPCNWSEEYSGKKKKIPILIVFGGEKMGSLNLTAIVFFSPEYEGSWGLEVGGRKWVLGSEEVRKQNEIFDVVSKRGSLQENFIVFQEYIECLYENGDHKRIIIPKFPTFWLSSSGREENLLG